MRALRIRLELVAVFSVLSASALHGAIFDITEAAGFFPGGQVQVKFEDLENVGVDGGTPGVLDVGDTLRGILRVTSSSQGPDQYQPDADDPFELTGIFEAVVAGFEDTGGVSDASAIRFEPYAPFAADVAAITGLPVGDVTGAMIALFEDDSPDWLNDTTSVAAAEGDATDGSLFAVLGGVGTWGTDYYWGADGPRSLPANATVSTSFAASIQLLVDNTGLNFDDDINQLPTTLVGVEFGPGLGAILNEFGIKGSVKLAQDSDPRNIYALRSDDPVTASTSGVGVIPEATSVVSWLGLIALGCVAGLGARRRKTS
jgi:hypothetical protein